MTHVDLFSGIGGFALAARWAGIKTVQFVEIDPFCQKVLRKNFQGVPIHDDIKTYSYSNRDGLQEQGAEQQASGDRQFFQGRPFGGKQVKSTPFILTGGFPCQPFSCAGKRKGKEDNRFLWPEMLRVISEVKPTWVIGENVSGFINMGLDDCISDLEREGYEVQTLVIPACAVNAPHRRDRVWIVGYAESARGTSEIGEICQRESANGYGIFSDAADTPQRQDDRRNGRGMDETPTGGEGGNAATGVGNQDVTDTTSRQRLQGYENVALGNGGETWEERGGSAVNVANPGNQRFQGVKQYGALRQNGRSAYDAITECNRTWAEPWPEVATRLCRVDDGLPRRMDRVNRLKALGNAVVPQIPYLIMKALVEMEYLNNTLKEGT